ncbi:MAG: LysE family translocator [Rhodobacteraceae bacterium]|nr:LysE family translocator [Paracoccaceae bacterium]
MAVDLVSFVTVWSFIGLNVLSPGPNVLNTITISMGSGRGPGLAAAAGVGLGIVIWCLGMSLGVAMLFALFPVAQSLLRLVGAGLLIWFASRYLRSAWRGFHRQPAALSGVGGLSRSAAFLRSLMVIALNPKALTTWLFVLTIFPIARAGAADVAVLCAGTVIVAAGIHSGYAVIFSTRRAARAYLKAAPFINAAVGVFFLVVATELALSVLG